MKKITFLFAALLLLALPVYASSGLDDFIEGVNVDARVDLGDFKVRLSNQFGVSQAQIETVFKATRSPGDAYMCLKVGDVASQPLEKVIREYQENENKGWGLIAKNLGIKPGSAQFRALKEGGPGAGAKGKKKQKSKHKK